MTDIDRRCLKQNEEARQRIARMDRMLGHPRCTRARRAALKAQRDALLIELHDAMRMQDSYDRRFAEAMDDPTGQDLDFFDPGE